MGGADVAADLTGKFSPMGGRAFDVDGMDMPGVRWGGFGYFGGGHYRTTTGSYVCSNDLHLLAGTGLRVNHGTGGKTDFGMFVEGGWGSYDTYNSFWGDGDSANYGGGLLFRHDSAFGTYGEASVRLGHARSEYNAHGFDTDFDIRSMYYGGHIGVGHIFRLTQCQSIDLSARGLWTRLDGDTDTNSGNGRMEVGDTDSLRSQLGLRYNYAVSNRVTTFVKGAWEYEFDGETKGWYTPQGGARERLHKTDMGGSSGLAELGVDIRVNDRTSIGVAVHGIIGQRRGFGGNIGVSFGF